MKKLFVCIYSLLMLFAFSFPTLAATQDNANDTAITGYMPIEVTQTEPYYVDEEGNILKERPSTGMYVEVLYDSRWDNKEIVNGTRATAYQYININNIVLKSSPTGHYANSIYYSRINVGMTVYFDTNTMRITSVDNASVLSTYCPILTSHSAATVSAYASGGRAYATGYITYYDPYVETLSGTGSWGWV
ncbi:unknown [Firmicutes bacterium CAG:308]|nr:unknown [Firmicutes bacterium CAG:308]